MKARLPKEYTNGNGVNNLQQLAKKAQIMQEKIEKIEGELALKEYVFSSGGEAVKAIVSGEMKLKEVLLKDDVINKDDKEILSDLIISAVNGALEIAKKEKEEKMEAISGGAGSFGF